MRMVLPGQQALVARHIGELEPRLYAHRLYLESKPVPTSLDALLDGHALIGFDQATPFLRDLQSRLPIARELCTADRQ